MATLTVRPNADGSYNENYTLYPASPTDHYVKVNESSADDDSSYIASSTSGYGKDYFKGDFSSLPSGCTINSVKVYVRAKKTSLGNLDVKISIYDGSNHSQNSTGVITTSYVTYEHEFSNDPGGGSWTRDDLVSSSFEFGFELGDPALANRYVRVTQVYIIIDYSLNNHPSPTSLQCERATNPASVSQLPIFTAIFNGYGGSGTATHYEIEVSPNSDFSSPVWDTGWQSLGTPVSSGNRCEEISYNGTLLSSDPQPDNKYYWRIRFKDASIESEWSASAEFCGIRRPWQNSAYAFRHKLLWNSDHAEIPAGYDQDFYFKTGNRVRIATNGCFDESIQQSGGFQLAYHNGRTHLVYLSKTDQNDKYCIYIVSYDHLTKTWGEPFFVSSTSTSYDIHYFPSICIDNNGYIYVFYGCHCTQLYYRMSTYPNESGSLPGDHKTGTWSGVRSVTGATQATYPVAYCMPDGRVYVHYRTGSGGTQGSVKYAFNYTADGINWQSSPYNFIYDTFYQDSNNKAFCVYVYGVRLDIDKATPRLHISFSHVHTVGGVNNIRRGIWYAYSDYNETDPQSLDVGFNIWRDAAGNIIGRTGVTPIDYDSNKAIILRDNHYLNIFSTNMVLDRSGDPIPLFACWWKDDNPFQEPTLFGAKWGGSSWNIIKIGEQIGLKMRAARCSLGIMTDRDGVIRGWLPVNAKTFFHYIPNADVDSVGVTRKSGSDNYAMVNEGFEWLEWNAVDGRDTSYIDIAAGGKASFTASESIPSDATILRVDVEAIARYLTSLTYIKLYLNNGVSDNDGSEWWISSGEYQRAVQSWTQNPFTSTDWTKTAVESLRFGIKNTDDTDSVRVKRVIMRAYYTQGADDEITATEIVEIVSYDDGATWAKTQVTQNSHLGTCIASQKHHLTNKQIEIVWSAGNDIFYLSDMQYGLVRTDGKDLKIYYGDTEIDRVVDFMNMVLTRITFKVQETIPAGAVAGPKDYYLVISNADETDQPKADPQNIKRYFENFETYSNGQNMNGVGGWTVNSGTATIYASPPYDTNKVFAGNNSLKCIESGTFEIEQTLGSGLTDVFVEVGLWLEGVIGSRILVKLVDGSSNNFSAGIYRSSGCATYGINDSFTEVTSINAARATMNEVKIHVTSKGCSAWLNGNVICTERTAITSVDKLVLYSDDDAYFDYIRVGYRLSKSGDATTIAYGDIQDPTVVYHSETPGSDYNSQYDGLHEFTQTRGVKIEVKLGAKSDIESSKEATFKIWISPNNPYDEEDILTSDTLVITLSATPGNWEYDTIIFDNLPSDQYSVKVDCYSYTGSDPGSLTVQITELKIYNQSKEPEIVVQSLEARGFYLGGYLLGGGDIIFRAGGYVEGTFIRQALAGLLEYTGYLTANYKMLLENNDTLQLIRKLPSEWRGYLTANYKMPVDYLAGIASIVEKFNLDYGEGALLDTIAVIEYRQGLIAGKNIIFENLVITNVVKKTFIDYCLAMSATLNAVVSYDYGYNLKFKIPLEYFGTLNVAAPIMPVEYRATLSRDLKFPFEHSITSRTARSAIYENLRGFSKRSKLTVDFKSSINLTRKIPVEYGLAAERTFSPPVDYGLGLNSFILSPVDYLFTTAAARRLPMEYQGAVVVQIPACFPVEYGTGFTASPKMPFEQRTSFIHNQTFPVSACCIVNTDLNIPIEHRSGLAVSRIINLDFGAMMSAGRQAVIGYGEGFSHRISSPVAYLAGLIASQNLQFEYKSTLSVIRRLAAAWLEEIPPIAVRAIAGCGQGLDSKIIARLEYKAAVLAASSLPVEYAGGAAVTFGESLPIEWLSAVNRAMKIPLEHLDTVSRVECLPLSHNITVTGLYYLPLEHNQIIVATCAALTMWLSSVNATASLVIENKAGLKHDLKVNIDYGSGVQSEIFIPLEYCLGCFAEARLPVEWYGIAIVAIIIANARMRIPEIYNARMRTSGISKPVMKIAEIIEADMKGF